MECETVKIVAPVSDENTLGYIIINKTDLSDGQTLFDDKPAPAPRKAPAKAADKPTE